MLLYVYNIIIIIDRMVITAYYNYLIYQLNMASVIFLCFPELKAL